MANHQGSEGTVLNGANAIAELRAWNLSTTVNMIEDTELGDTWKTKKAGTKEWSGNIDTYWDETDTNGQVMLKEGNEVTLNLHPETAISGATYYTGNAIITGVTRQAAIDGMVEASYTFEGNGALTESIVA